MTQAKPAYYNIFASYVITLFKFYEQSVASSSSCCYKPVIITLEFNLIVDAITIR